MSVKTYEKENNYMYLGALDDSDNEVSTRDVRNLPLLNNCQANFYSRLMIHGTKQESCLAAYILSQVSAYDRWLVDTQDAIRKPGCGLG